MKLRAQIVIEVEAEDFVTAANHERAIQDIFRNVKNEYEIAQLEFREVRGRSAKEGEAGLRKMRRYTGNLNTYAD